MADPEDTQTCARQRAAFEAQRRSAKRRGIPFLFTFAEWQAWWDYDGRWPERGRGRDKLCMARFGDRGPYSPSNVYCTSFAGNAADVPPAVRKERRDRAAATARANANYSMPWLGIREGHPMARPVLTPLGRFGSAALAAEAHGIHSSSATLKARTGWKGWSYE